MLNGGDTVGSEDIEGFLFLHRWHFPLHEMGHQAGSDGWLLSVTPPSAALVDS